MSSGHTGTEAAPVQAIVAMFQKHPGLQNFQIWPCMCSRQYLVPYGAGRSADGFMTYIDQGVPRRFKMGVEPDKYAACHEGFEYWLMTRLDKAYWLGPGAKSAHWWATGYEHYNLKMDGWSDDEIAAYEAEWATCISTSEADRISIDTVPPDLYQGPYEGPAEDNDVAEDHMDERILPILQAARSRMLLVQNARV